MQLLDNICVLIPAYKPSQTMTELVAELTAEGFNKIVVVDDGSGPEYEHIFSELPPAIIVLSHTQNMGKGRALKTGLKYIQNNISGCEGVVTCDADGQHRVRDIYNVALEFLNDKNSLVLGSRMFDENIPKRSAFGNSLTRGVFYISSGVKLRDTQTGLRAFSCEAIPWLAQIEGERYEYEMNVLLECARRKFPMREVAIEAVYINNNSASHFKVLRDSFLIYSKILKFSLSSFVCFGIDFIMLFLFRWITGGLKTELSLLVSVVAARFISSIVNYYFNKNLVFKGNSSYSLVKYYLLAGFILAANFGIIYLLTEIMGIPLFWAKIITELTLFFVSFMVQKKYIFKQHARSKQAG